MSNTTNAWDNYGSFTPRTAGSSLRLRQERRRLPRSR
ncbi:hypothetical protein L915_17468 [Phytophthora nicotianae]|uniref:Uncharacterized protein n=1 Tax=Phytophthora nicotianae TaxID=4792 RepID=W2I5M5_PHYNI|nr:hypothetical protein L915_17468 [Phytophthora nicotianae]ETL29466.1 hypothetical protein L916_17361 [Phytophthora nicotianae]ETM35928.1 hypothetical protein L914_17260 [Phytophthora nicotianae]